MIPEVTATVIFVILFYFLTKWCVNTRRYIKLMRKFPSPPTNPLFGNALSFKTSADFIPTFAKFTKLYGNKVSLYFGIFPSMLITTDEKLAATSLTSNKILKKGREYDFLKRWLGKGLLISRGDDRWRKHRKLINPSFHMQLLKDFIETFQTNANILVKKLEGEVGKSSFDVYPYVTMCSLDIICETAMGSFINSQEDNYSDYVKCVKLMCKLVVKRAFNAFFRVDFFYMFSKLYREEKGYVKVLNEYAENVIKQKTKNTYGADDINNTSKRKLKMALLDSLLQLNKESQAFTDEDIRDEVNTFMFAGHDTTASALTFTLFALANNQKVQEKVVEEIETVCSNDEKEPLTLNDIQSMKYLEAVIKEVLRIYPSVPHISRIVEEDFEFDGYTIPKGCSLLVDIYGIHHNEKLFPEPETFNPERFLSENANEGLNNVYMPFGFGPRHCIGQKFAMIELKTVVTTLLRHYKFDSALPTHELKLCSETILVSANGVLVSLTRRNDNSKK